MQIIMSYYKGLILTVENGRGVYRIAKVDLNNGRTCYLLYGDSGARGWRPMRLREQDILTGYPSTFDTKEALLRYVDRLWTHREEYCYFMSYRGISSLTFIESIKV